MSRDNERRRQNSPSGAGALGVRCTRIQAWPKGQKAREAIRATLPRHGVI